MSYKTYKSRDEMRADGYTFEGSSECNKCGAQVEWVKTKNGKKVPFDMGSTVCHFDTCGKPAAQQQPAPQSASSAHVASPVAQELVVAVRALNQNVSALEMTMKALLARLSQGQQPAAEQATSKPNGSGAPTPNIHGVNITDEDIPF